MPNTGIGILNFSLVFYMRDVFNSTSAEIGWFSSLWAFSYLIGCFLLHKLSRTLGAHRSIATATFIMALVVILMMFSKSLFLMYILYSIFGLITALFWPPLMGWLSEDLEGSELNRVMGFFNLSWSTGLVLSPYLAGLLLELNLNYPFRFIIVIYGLLSIALVVIPMFSPRLLLHGKIKNEKKLLVDSSTPLRYVAWLGNLTGYIVFGVILFVFPLYAREELQLAESSIGLLLLFRALFSTFIFVLAGKLSWWHYNKVFMLILQFLTVVFALFIPYIRSWLGFTFSMFLFGVLFAAQYSSSIFHGVSGSIHREKRMAIHESVLTIGIILGAVGGGEIYQRWGMVVAFNVAAAAAALILILQVIIIVIQNKNKFAFDLSDEDILLLRESSNEFENGIYFNRNNKDSPLI
jgi:MFS family permease